MKKDYLYIIIAVLILLNVYTINKISNIENSIDGNIQDLYNEQNNIRNEMNNIYTNVDVMLKKQASMLDSYEVTFGDEFNTDNFTVPVNISMTPKENTDDLAMDLLINGERYEMIKNGTSFTASINTYVFDSFFIKAVMKSSGIEKVETINEYNDLQYKYLLQLFGDFIGNTKYSSGKYQYDGDIVIHYLGPEDNYPENISISKYINGIFVDEQPVDMHGNESIMHSVKEEDELSANDKIEIYINVEDKYSLNYKYIVLADEIDSNGKLVTSRPEWTNGSLVEIKDRNGNVLLDNFKNY